MTCPACGAFGERGSRCCAACVLTLAPGGERRLHGGVLVAAAYAHRGAARVLVHRLKYAAFPTAAIPLARAMAPLVGPAEALVPVRRARVRRWRYGVDPAVELAHRLSVETGVRVVKALVPGWWHPARAGPAGRRRGVPGFRAAGSLPAGIVLVDDVVTTGATLGAAAAALGGSPRRAVVATASPGLLGPVPVRSGQQPLAGHTSTGDCVSGSDRIHEPPLLTAAAP